MLIKKMYLLPLISVYLVKFKQIYEILKTVSILSKKNAIRVRWSLANCQDLWISLTMITKFIGNII